MNMINRHIGWKVQIMICRRQKQCRKQSVFCMSDLCAIKPSKKALKGVYVSRKPEEELPYIHKLKRLANLAEISDEMNDPQLALLDTLSPLNIEARYPLHKAALMESLTPERCKELIEKTEEMLSWLKTKC